MLCSFLPVFSFHLTICFRHFHGFLVLISVPLLSFCILFFPFVLSFSLGFLFCPFSSLFSSLAFSLKNVIAVTRSCFVDLVNAPLAHDGAVE